VSVTLLVLKQVFGKGVRYVNFRHNNLCSHFVNKTLWNVIAYYPLIYVCNIL